MSSSTVARVLRGALAASCAVMACAEPETIEIPIVGPPFACVLEQPPLAADLFVVELHRLQSPPPNPELACVGCMNGEIPCELVDVSCRCGGRVEVNRANMDEALAGVRISGLEPRALYCLRIQAIETGETRDSFEDCDCPEPDLDDRSQACGLSRVFDPAGTRDVQVEPMCYDSDSGPYQACAGGLP